MATSANPVRQTKDQVIVPVTCIILGSMASFEKRISKPSLPAMRRPVIGSQELNDRLNSALALIAAKQGHARTAAHFATIGQV